MEWKLRNKERKDIICALAHKEISFQLRVWDHDGFYLILTGSPHAEDKQSKKKSKTGTYAIPRSFL